MVQLVEDYMTIKAELDELKKEVLILKKKKNFSFYNFLWKTTKDMLFSISIGYALNSWLFASIYVIGSQFFS